MLGGGLAAAIYVIFAVKVAATTESLPMTAYQFGFGALLSLPFAVWQLLYNHVINFVPASLAGVTLNLIPLFGVLTAIIFLDEHLTVWHIVGGIVVISGIMLFPTGKHDEPRPGPGL